MPPLVGVAVHVDDVARAHIDALKSSVLGNADYILTADGVEGVVWDDGKKAVRNLKGAEVLKMNGIMETVKWRVDSSVTNKVFGWECRTFEITMRDLVRQYLELVQ